MPGEKISFMDALAELCVHSEKVGISNLRAAKQMIGFGVGILKKQGYDIDKVIKEITAHWSHIPGPN